MKMTFDLVDQPWIPVAVGGGVQELGLRDVLCKAHDIDSIAEPIPVVEFGVYRLLSAVALDIWRFANNSALERLMDAGKFDAPDVDRYFGNCGHCFDLFGSERPFLQVSDMDMFPERPLAGLLPSIPSGSASLHFHHYGESDFGVSPAVAARLLATVAPFMTAGGAGLAPSINGAPPWYVLINGEKLFQTICLNCFAGPHDSLGLRGDAPPAWRNPEPPKHDGRSTKASLLEALTWRPRMIKLVPSGPGVCSVSGHTSDVIVRSMRFRAGASCDFSWTDPSVPYKTAGNKPPLVMRPREDRQIWRDTGPLALLNNETYRSAAGDVSFSRPRLVDQFANLVRDRRIPDDTELSITVYGMRTDMKMKVFEWQKEQLNVPVRMVKSNPYAGLVQESMDRASSVERHLEQALRYLAPSEGTGNAKAFSKVITNAVRGYWEELREHYSQMLRQLACLVDGEASGREAAIVQEWRRRVIGTAMHAFDLTADGLDTYGRNIRKMEVARQQLRVKANAVFETLVEKQARANRKARTTEGGKR